MESSVSANDVLEFKKAGKKFHPFPQRTFVIILLFTLAIFLHLIYQAWIFYRDFNFTATQIFRLQELSGVITNLDEVLTMSARMAVATSDLKWETRYRKYEPILDSTIQTALKLVPDAFLSEAALQTNTANLKLVKLENNAFDLIRSGNNKSAAALLSSEEYEQEKQLYAEGLKKITATISNRASSALQEQRKTSLVTGIIITVTIAILLTIWIIVLRILRNYTNARKKTEEASQHERNFLRVLIDNLPELFYYKDEQGRYILNNPAHLRSIGAKCQEDVVGKTTFDYHPRELAEKYFADEMKVVRSGEAMIRKEELCFRRDTGKMHWHLTSKIPVKDSKGKVTGFVCISHDITEQKRVQEAFEHERNLLRTLIDTMPELINYKDLEGRYLLNNHAHLQSLGVEHQADVLGKTMFDFHPAELVQRYYEYEMQVLKTGEAVFNKEEIVLHRDTGEQRWHLTSKVPLKDSQGKVTSYITISTDITDRKHFEEALEHERNLLRTLIDNLPVLIFSKDTEGRYILNNLPHLRSIGVQRQEDTLGKTTFYFNPPELAKQYSEDEMKVVQTGQAMYEREELAFHRDTGEQRWHLTSKIPLVDSRGKVIGMVGIASDITERKNAEAERERMIKELQDALADIKTLSGLVPICANCKKIRDDKGFWMQVESYIQERSQARFSHGICPDCIKKLYPNVKQEN
ncbi:MAG: PAS domain-containing protein [Bacteroidota bacterium]